MNQRPFWSGHRAGYFKKQLSQNCSCESCLVLDRHDESIRSPNHALRVVSIDIWYGEKTRGPRGTFDDEWQAIDNDTLGYEFLTDLFDRQPLIIGAVTGNIDHSPQTFDIVVRYQRCSSQ